MASCRLGRQFAATRPLVTTAGGGSNGYRNLAVEDRTVAFAAGTGMAIPICWLPSGTSTWNEVEHRVFAHVSMNWRGVPDRGVPKIIRKNSAIKLEVCPEVLFSGGDLASIHR